jgi:hypothetical protein
MMLSSLNKKQTVSWEDVFQTWKAGEGADPVWQTFAREEKGWESWEAWRRYQSGHMNPESRAWTIYEILEPNKIIPQFRIGPFRGWQQHFDEKNVHTFADLVRDHADWARENIGVRLRLKDFPRETQFIGLYIKRNDTIVLYEGHHRAAAIALGVHDGMSIAFQTPPTIALTVIEGDEMPMLDRLLEMKSDHLEN